MRNSGVSLLLISPTPNARCRSSSASVSDFVGPRSTTALQSYSELEFDILKHAFCLFVSSASVRIFLADFVLAGFFLTSPQNPGHVGECMGKEASVQEVFDVSSLLLGPISL
mmetsp:Transcript_13679/g.47447  ORF Transcript_13679/g.47447 Transcript_13679/m.47447 type:complete len:112 (+) Transcript_13679:670-1005(+)